MARPTTWLEWFPVLMRFGGFGFAAALGVVWFLTDRIEPTLLAMAGGMMGVGEGADAIKELARARGDGGRDGKA